MDGGTEEPVVRRQDEKPRRLSGPFRGDLPRPSTGSLRKPLKRQKGNDILLLTGNQTMTRASERRSKMGIYRRARVWHMTFFYQGKRYRKSTETTDKKLAQRIYDKLKNEIAEGKWFEKLPGEYKSFNEMMDKYKVEHVSQKASARQYKGYIKNLRPFFGETLICQVTPSMINEYKIKRRNDGVGPASINRELAMVKNAFNKAVKEWGWVRDNPVTRISMEKEPPGRVRYLTTKSLKSFLNACPEWLRSIVLTARHTGLRKENILSLKWHQVDLFRRVITVERTKNGERLGIPINDTLLDAIQETLKGAIHSNRACLLPSRRQEENCQRHI